MTHRRTLRLTIAAALAAGALAGCGDTPPTGVETLDLAQGNPDARILVDASRDGGVWWFPQWAGAGGFDPTRWHQGTALADSLRAIGYDVRELPRPYTITPALLDSFDLVLRAGVFGGYDPSEIAAYQAYVRDGGRLFLVADHMMFSPVPADPLANAFGLQFAGITRGETTMLVTGGHPVTDGVASLDYGAGSGLLAYPDSAVILGRLPATGYLDRNNDSVQDGDEPSAPAVFGVMVYGAGRIVFCGDLNVVERVPQPLLGNVLRWLD